MPRFRSPMRSFCRPSTRTARDGREALAAYERERPRVVLLDYVMPQMNGFEALEAIRVYEEMHHLPAAVVFMVSASTLEEEAARCLAAGAQAFVRKPLKKDELISLVAGYVPFETEQIDAGERGVPVFARGAGEGFVGRGSTEDVFLEGGLVRTALDNMDGEKRETLRRSVRIGDVRAVRAIAEDIAGEQPDFSRHLASLALSFDLAALKELFDDGE